MNINTIKLLEYDKILELLAGFAVSEKVKENIKNSAPSADIAVIKAWMHETTDARRIVDISSNVPLHSLTNIDKILSKIDKDEILIPEELTVIAGLLDCVNRLRLFMKRMIETAPIVASFALSMYEINDLSDEINRCIEHDRVADRASSDLSRIRRKILIIDERIRQKLADYINSSAYSSYIQDSTVSVRDGRYVIPVKREYQKNIIGKVIDKSSTGSTVFVEPEAVKKMHDELNNLRIAEENEVFRVLSYLTNRICGYRKEISINIEAMLHYDLLFAKAKFSKSMDCRAVELNTDGLIKINKGRHPLIGQSVVPLDILIGYGYKALIITGPNTGGKTVALKTAGLMTMMVQSGLHVPVGEDSEFAVFTDILVDIGDGQSIEQSLSTFSGHLKNISSILECADSHTLVIMDELGAGTDPGEGMGLAVAVLERVYQKGATIFATTHYSEIKSFAADTVGFENGCMEFDLNTLKPLYRLKIGKAGESNALLIALRLGIDRKVIERAHMITYKEIKDYGNHYREAQVIKVADEDAIKTHTEGEDKIKKTFEKREYAGKKQIKSIFNIGDCAYISTIKRTGIVCEAENAKGDVGVLVMNKTLMINKKRLSIHIEGKELYPENYDMDIVLESKENRKKKHVMGRKNIRGLVIEKEERS